MRNLKTVVYKLTTCIAAVLMLITVWTPNFVFAENSEPSEKQFSFWVISDLHSGNWDGFFQQPKIRAALTDIQETDPNTSAIITNGDNVESNIDGCWEQLVKAINDTIGNSIPMYFTIGNHELKYEEQGTYGEKIERYLKYTNSVSAEPTDSVYYAHKINGQYFIHLGSQTQTQNGHADLHQDQLDWLKGALKRAKQEGTRAYVFIHQPLKNTVSGTLENLNQNWNGVVQDSELREILDSYPNVLVFSGHTHINLECVQPALLGGKDKPSYFNDAAIGKMVSMVNNTSADYEGSQGLCVEVYNDKILVKGRDFSNKQWISAAQFVVDINNNNPSEEKPQIMPEFLDANGDKLNNFNSIVSTDNVKVHIPMTDEMKKNNAGTAIVAFYDSDGRYIKLCTEEITDFSNDIEFSMGETIKETGGSIKVVIWDSLNTMDPLCKYAEIK